jgi:hypothetical protein
MERCAIHYGPEAILAQFAASASPLIPAQAGIQLE